MIFLITEERKAFEKQTLASTQQTFVVRGL